jgi:hypothetical protein
VNGPNRKRPEIRLDAEDPPEEFFDVEEDWEPPEELLWDGPMPCDGGDMGDMAGWES